MAPENEARPQAAFYDHESEEPRRRRRPAADWGVAEDIFDRMPSRRFKRSDRRPDHRDEIVIRRSEDTDERRAAPGRAASWGEDARAGDERGADAWGDERGSRSADARGDERGSRSADARGDERGSRSADARGDERGSRGAASWDDERGSRGADARGSRSADERGPRAGDESRGERATRIVDSWDDDAGVSGSAAPGVDSWMDDAPLVPGESRTIVLGTEEPAAVVGDAGEPRARKTVVISGHPDRLGVARQQRAPRTAVERIGASPDRIAGYAVALGFLLVLIAVLTTGQ